MAMSWDELLKRKAYFKKRKYYQDLEASREHARNQKRKEREENKDKVNERQRKWYARNRAANAAKINARRIQAHPYRGIRTAIQNCGDSPHEFDQLTRFLRERLTLCDGIRNPAKGIRPHSRGVHRAESPSNGEERM